MVGAWTVSAGVLPAGVFQSMREVVSGDQVVKVVGRALAAAEDANRRWNSTREIIIIPDGGHGADGLIEADSTVLDREGT